MRILKLFICLAIAATVLPLAQVSDARQGKSVVESCQTSPAAEAYDCGCFGENEAAIRQAEAEEHYETRRRSLEGQIKRIELTIGPSKARDDQLARKKQELAANKVDPAKVSPQIVTLNIVRANMCKSPLNFERTTREDCIGHGEDASFCACVGAASGKLWASTNGQMTQQTRIDLGTKAQLSCKPGGKPIVAGGAPTPTLPSANSNPGVNLPSIPGIKLPAGSLPIPLPGNSSTSKSVQCGVQICKASQKCVTDKLLGVTIQQCK